MKKFIISLLFLLSFCTSAFSQIEYPRYEKDSLGQTCVLLTIEQAQALDNSTDLLALFEKLNSQITNYDSVCIKVVADKDKVIAEQSIQIGKLKETLNVKDQQISTLQESLKKKDEIIENLKKEVKNGEETIAANKKEIKRIKGKMVLGGSLGGIAIIGLILGIIL
jgi:peptidoglycan hydrolase CwlO-like protein